MCDCVCLLACARACKAVLACIEQQDKGPQELLALQRHAHMASMHALWWHVCVHVLVSECVRGRNESAVHMQAPAMQAQGMPLHSFTPQLPCTARAVPLLVMREENRTYDGRGYALNTASHKHGLNTR